MDSADGAWTETQLQAFNASTTHPYDNGEKQKQQQNRRKWCTKSGSVTKKSEEDMGTEDIKNFEQSTACVYSWLKDRRSNECPRTGDKTPTCQEGIRENNSAVHSIPSIQFPPNKKPSLDPLDLRIIKEHEKKRKRKEKKITTDTSNVCRKSTDPELVTSQQKSKSASTYGSLPRFLLEKYDTEEAPATPSDSDFWDSTTNKIQSPVSSEPDIGLQRTGTPAPDSDDEYEVEMAYRFPVLYRRLSIMRQKPLTKECTGIQQNQDTVPQNCVPKNCESSEVVPTPIIQDPFKLKPPGEGCSRKEAYIVKDSNLDLQSADRSVNATGESRSVLYQDDLTSDLDRLLEELEEDW